MVVAELERAEEIAAEGGLLRAALAATGDGIGCHYRLGAELGLGIEPLAALELVKPIRQRIPTCAEHACPLRADCRHARLFADAAPGRSGKKYRLSSLGAGALRDPIVLRQVAAATRDLPLARRVLAALADAGGAATVLALNAALLDQQLAALARDGEWGEAAFGRAELAGTLALLAAVGAIRYDGYRVALPGA